METANVGNVFIIEEGIRIIEDWWARLTKVASRLESTCSAVEAPATFSLASARRIETEGAIM